MISLSSCCLEKAVVRAQSAGTQHCLAASVRSLLSGLQSQCVAVLLGHQKHPAPVSLVAASWSFVGLLRLMWPRKLSAAQEEWGGAPYTSLGVLSALQHLFFDNSYRERLGKLSIIGSWSGFGR